MDLVATSEVEGRFVVGRMKGALGIEFHIPFEFGREIVADDEANDPAVRSFVDKLVADFVVDVDWAEISLRTRRARGKARLRE